MKTTIPLLSRISAQLALVIGGLAFVYAGMEGRHAGWELMVWPVLACAPCALVAVVGAALGLRAGDHLHALRTAGAAAIGFVLAVAGLVEGA